MASGGRFSDYLAGQTRAQGCAGSTVLVVLVSNSRAASIRGMLITTRFCFEATAGKIHTRGVDSRHLSVSNVCELIKSAALAA